MIKATKKICSSIDSEFDDGLILKGLSSNPLELLKNPKLFMDFNFGIIPHPLFKVFYERYNKELIFSIVKNGKATQQERDLGFLILSLREDIPELHRFLYALNLRSKKNVQIFTKYYPEYKDWNYLIKTINTYYIGANYNKDTKTTPVKALLRGAYGNEPTRGFFVQGILIETIDFYSKTKSNLKESYEEIKKILSEVKMKRGNFSRAPVYKSIPTWCGNFEIFSILIDRYKKFLVSDKEDFKDLWLFIDVFSGPGTPIDPRFSKYISKLIWDKSQRNPDLFVINLTKLCSILLNGREIDGSLIKRCSDVYAMPNYISLEFLYKKSIKLKASILKYLVNDLRNSLSSCIEQLWIEKELSWIPFPWRDGIIKKLTEYYNL